MKLLIYMTVLFSLMVGLPTFLHGSPSEIISESSSQESTYKVTKPRVVALNEIVVEKKITVHRQEPVVVKQRPLSYSNGVQGTWEWRCTNGRCGWVFVPIAVAVQTQPTVTVDKSTTVETTVNAPKSTVVSAYGTVGVNSQVMVSRVYGSTGNVYSRRFKVRRCRRSSLPMNAYTAVYGGAVAVTQSTFRVSRRSSRPGLFGWRWRASARAERAAVYGY